MRDTAVRLLSTLIALVMLAAAAGADGRLVIASTTRPSTASDNDNPPIFIGLDAALSGRAGQSGEAIRRGLVVALNEINATGGVLGRPLELIQRDNRGIPDRGIDNIHELAKIEDLVAVFGGIHTPVAMAELKAIHEHRILYLDPWAAGTSVVDNGYEPNFVFRVSVRDQHAGGFLIEAARDRGFKRPGLLLWRTEWGRSSETAFTDAMTRFGMESAGVAWFNTSERDLSDQIENLIVAGADVIMLVAGPGEGLTAIANMAERREEHRLPIISHWGITGGDFFGLGRHAIEAVDLTFLQTYSFFEPTSPSKSDAFYAAYCERFGPCASPADIASPVGTAHAYDLAYLLKLAIEKAGTIDREHVRSAMERLQRHVGLVRVYDPPFTPQRHDALNATDFRLCKFDVNGAIIPLSLNLARQQ